MLSFTRAEERGVGGPRCCRTRRTLPLPEEFNGTKERGPIVKNTVGVGTPESHLHNAPVGIHEKFTVRPVFTILL